LLREFEIDFDEKYLFKEPWWVSKYLELGQARSDRAYLRHAFYSSFPLVTHILFLRNILDHLQL
jgi:hypothetical protein